MDEQNPNDRRPSDVPPVEPGKPDEPGRPGDVPRRPDDVPRRPVKPARPFGGNYRASGK